VASSFVLRQALDEEAQDEEFFKFKYIILILRLSKDAPESSPATQSVGPD
jgi:hypothetical protein